MELSKTEQRLLRLLVEHRGQTLTREQLLDRVWDGGEFVDENALSVAVKRLRDKLGGRPHQDGVRGGLHLGGEETVTPAVCWASGPGRRWGWASACWPSGSTPGGCTRRRLDRMLDRCGGRQLSGEPL